MTAIEIIEEVQSWMDTGQTLDSEPGDYGREEAKKFKELLQTWRLQIKNYLLKKIV